MRAMLYQQKVKPLFSFGVLTLWKLQRKFILRFHRAAQRNVHLSRLSIKLWLLKQNVYLAFSRFLNAEAKTFWFRLVLLSPRKQVKNKTFFGPAPRGYFWRKYLRQCSVFFNNTMDSLMWFAFLPLFRKRTLIYNPSSLKFWQMKITLHPGIRVYIGIWVYFLKLLSSWKNFWLHYMSNWKPVLYGHSGLAWTCELSL